ncbi:MAG: galactokinase [Methylocella sp.]
MIEETFQKIFGAPPEVVVRAPGRVNLIGEHTDYNDGFVLPAAIDRFVEFAGRRRAGRAVRVHSTDFQDSAEFALDSIQNDSEHGWSNYLRGISKFLESDGHRLSGADIVFGGNVPRESGLSSSAAVEVGATVFWQRLLGLQLDPVYVAKLSRRAENEFVGVPCGIMDQYTAVFAKAGQAILLDCQTLHYEHVPVDLGDAVFFIVDSGIRRKLEASDYSARQMECENAMQAMRPFYPGILSLRDVSMEQYERVRGKIPPNLEKRARHVIYENKRVNQMAAALKSKDAEGAGLLLTASHKSLSDLFEVSSSEIDLLVGMLIGIPGVLGARLMGAGFGGSILGLARNPDYGAIKRHLADKYTAVTGFATEVFPVHPSVGATLEKFL